MIDCLVGQQLLLLGLRLTARWFAVDADGVIAPPARGEVTLGGHAIVAVGYDLRRKSVLIRNSWGVDWGLSGHAWLPFGDLTKHCIAAMTMTPSN